MTHYEGGYITETNEDTGEEFTVGRYPASEPGYPDYGLTQALGGFAGPWHDYPSSRKELLKLAIERRRSRAELWERQLPDPFAKLNAEHERRALEVLLEHQKKSQP